MTIRSNLLKRPSPALQPSAPRWSTPVGAALDLHGPAAIPFDEPPDDFTERSVIALFEAAALRRPHSIALSGHGGNLTFAGLYDAVAVLAGQISDMVPRNGAVAVLLPNTPASVVALLACLGAGRYCIILNAEHPVERNAAILKDAGVHAIIVQSRGCPEASQAPSGAAVIALDEVPTALSKERAPRFAPRGPDEAAIILYTSGSTGQPKGIVLTQATILARVRNNIISMHLHDGDRFLSLGALGTTAGLVASMVALLGGAQQFVMSVSTAGAGNLLGLIRDQQVTILWGVPALLRLLFESDGAREALTSLRLVRTFGDRLLKVDLEAWRGVLPRAAHFAVTYGQTEVTAAQWFVPRGFVSDDASLPTGYILPEHQFAVLGDDGEPVAQGAVGELVLRSRYVALGEWKDGRCSGGRVHPDPLDPRLRILATGDLVRLGADGLLQVIGRRDRQVKIRGQRVEPAEIEDVLRRVPGIAEAAVAVKRLEAEAMLLAFIVADDFRDTTILDRANAAVGAQLPPYMRPSRLLVIERMPLLPGGKIDEKALLAIEAASPREHAAKAHAASASPRARRAVARAWLRVLDRPSLEADAPFEQAGGDSLRLLRFIFALEGQYRTSLPLDVFFANLRPSEFAQRLDLCLQGTPSRAPAIATPVFLFPGMGRDEPRLVRFRLACTPPLRMVPLDYGDWPEWTAPDFDFSKLIARLVRAIEDEAPAGPLYLVGYSLGGEIAHAVAAALSASGRSVAFLGILDTNIAAAEGADAPAQPFSRRREIRALVQAMRKGDVADELALMAARRLLSPRWKPVLRLVARSHRFTLPYDFGFYLNRRLRMPILVDLVRAGVRQTPSAQPLHIPAVLFRSLERGPDVPEDLGWRKLCPDITVMPIAGGHSTMFDPPNLEPLSRRFVSAFQTITERAGAA